MSMRPIRRAALAVLALGTAGFLPVSGETSASATPAVATTTAGVHHVPVPAAARAIDTSHPDHVVGRGTAASCTSAAVIAAVAKVGLITFRCGPKPVTITMLHTIVVHNTEHRVVIDGGNKVTLAGGGKRQILHIDTCNHPLPNLDSCYQVRWPYLVVQNLTLRGGNSQVKQSPNGQFGGGGGGAIYDLGGRLKVVNTRFVDNRCYRYGPDLGGAGIRALSQWQNEPVYINHDTFRGGRCSNGSALSSIGTSWVVLNSTMTDNKAIGYGQNPAESGTPGGGSGGAIYTDGDRYKLVVAGTLISHNHANEGGGAIFYVSDDNTGTLTIKDSTRHDNPSDVFWTRPYPGIFYHSSGHPTVTDSTID
jgi:hypothetical protein